MRGSKRRVARDKPKLATEPAISRYRFLRAYYRFRKKITGRGKLNVSLIELEAFFGEEIGLSQRSVANIRLGARNLSEEKAEEVKKLLGPGSVIIDPMVLTKHFFSKEG